MLTVFIFTPQKVYHLIDDENIFFALISFLVSSILNQLHLEAFITDRHNLYWNSTALITKVFFVLRTQMYKT